MRDSIISSRYSNALINSIETETQEETIEKLIIIIRTLLNKKDYWKVFKSPNISQQKKSEFLIGLTKVVNENEKVANFFRILVTKGRLDLLPTIQAHLEDQLLALRKELFVTIESPSEFSNSQKTIVMNYFNDVTNKSIKPSFVSNSELLGGFKANLGNVSYDGSVLNTLDALTFSF